MKTILFALILTLALSACRNEQPHAHGAEHSDSQSDEHGHAHGAEHSDEHEHGDHAATEIAKGPNGGRLLSQGDVQLELAIFEDGVAPEYRAWISKNGQTVAPADGQLSVQLTRLGGAVDAMSFRAVQIEGKAFLQSTSEVKEPHSFDVAIALQLDGEPIRFAYESYEGRVQIESAVAKQSGITTAIATPTQLMLARQFFAVIEVDPNRVAKVSARFAGPIQQILVGENAVVKKGQALAVIQSNQSLTNYTLYAPIAGIITDRRASVGAMAGSAALFEITDLSEVHVDAQAFADDARLLSVGQRVRIQVSEDDTDTIEGTIERIKPIADAASGAVRFHSVIENKAGRWRPGQSAIMRVISEQAVLAVDERAIQRFRDWQVVFIQVGDTFEIRPLELGRSDGRFVEVLAGLSAGDRYVVEQSFLIKADIEKSGASHDH